MEHAGTDISLDSRIREILQSAGGAAIKGTWQTTHSGSRGLGVAVIVALVLLGSGVVTAIMHTLAVLLIAAIVAIPVTAVSIIALAAQRARSQRPGRPDGPAWVSREPPGMRPGWRFPTRRSSRLARCAFTSTSKPEQLAAIMRPYAQ